MIKLPYSSIPEHPKEYTAAGVLSVFLDGLGFRYYWATEGLDNDSLHYDIGNGVRTIYETLVHIWDLSEGIRKVAGQEVLIPPFIFDGNEFPELRSKTLLNIEGAAEIFRKCEDTDLHKNGMKLKLDDNIMNYPLWNVITGPVTDMGYHIGQIATFRRIAGNPVQEGINPFLGRINERM